MDAATLEPVPGLEPDLTVWKTVVQPTHPTGKTPAQTIDGSLSSFAGARTAMHLQP